jgi:catechol 2,3-dioxygenase-like lactoylglutathione lyase family enzyme
MTGSPRRIDHLVLAVRDLEGAAAFYSQLGFQVGARNRHPWGTENHVIQFGSSFLELITVADAAGIPPHSPGIFSFGAFVRDYLSEREGLAMLVLDSADAAADADSFARAGIGAFAPFSFQRTGRAADGTETRVAFSLAFARDDRLPDAAFFTCQQHYPEAFWSPQLQRHRNGATNVIRVALDVASPKEHIDFLRAFTGVTPTGDLGSFPLAADGAIELESTSRADRFTAFTVSVPALDRVEQTLGAGDIPFQRHSGRVVVPAEHAFGVRIEFDQRVG